MTRVQRQHTPEQEDQSETNLVSLLREGQNRTSRLSQHACLLERRLRLGADPADLLVLVQDIKFTVDDLQSLFRSVLHVTASSPDGAHSSAGATEGDTVAPLRIEVIELGRLFSHCVNSVQRQTRRAGVSLLCDIAPDLPTVTTDPEKLEQIVSLLLGHMVGASGKGGLEVRVYWSEDALVIDVYDAGRGLSKETYVALRRLVKALHGAIVVTRELGVRSRVELGFPSAQVEVTGVDMPRGEEQ